MKLTPMLRQYLRIKERHRDAILFFRLGDFYEMFFEDAERASRVLDIALTSRNRNDEAPVPLCGVPYHAASPYIGRLLHAGYKVAICEQFSDPKAVKGVMDREVVRVITPGTVLERDALEAENNNFLVAVWEEKGGFGLALTDVTTGEFRFSQFPDYASLSEEIGRIGPVEIIVPESKRETIDRLRSEFFHVQLSPVPEESFTEACVENLRSRGLWSGLRDEEWELGIRASAAIVAYLERNLPDGLKVLRALQFYRSSQCLILDEATRRNLELVRDFQGNKKSSLLGVLDRALTPMGARSLRQWILYPLLEEEAIRKRQQGVGELVEEYGVREDMKTAMKSVQDLERLAGRIVAGRADARDLVATNASLRALEPIRRSLSSLEAPIFGFLSEKLCDLPELVDLVARAIVDDPPATLKEGGFIRAGFHRELDDLRSIRKNAKAWIEELESRERRRTGIGSLKVKYNRVFGYSIEVTKPNLPSVPPDYVRRQTLVNGERFITSELKEYESKVLNSQEEIFRLEQSLFQEVQSRAASFYPQLKDIGSALATLDVLLSLAEVAVTRHFICPTIDSGYGIAIREGRHPVVEESLGGGGFVPNDCFVDNDTHQILILTGPNMAGKSTYMRQVALIVILAQMGSYVPASEARIGIVDRVFTRVGAADSLARGESTFMVEMKETAHILRHATPRSLVLLDEVGRGTSTFDGISIAWSVAEFLHDSSHRPRTLFATHYHELADLALTKERVKNFNFSVKEWKGEVIFLRSLAKGAASRSYGIQVASLAGLPPEVIARAKEVLANLERGELDERGRPRLARGSEGTDASHGQMPLFRAAGDRLLEDLRGIDVSTVTPVEALNRLHDLVERSKNEGK